MQWLKEKKNVSLVEQELYTIPEYQSSPLVYRIFSFLCSVLCKIVCFSFLLAIALLVLGDLLGYYIGCKKPQKK
jgi:uncharacterized membrane protein